MAVKPENTFRNSVHKHLEGVYHMKLNNPYLGGPPDDWYSGSHHDLWVEYKFIVLPKRDDTLINVPELLSPLQRDWINNRLDEGRMVDVIVGCKEGGVIFRDREWHKPISKARFAKQLRSREQIADYLFTTTCLP